MPEAGQIRWDWIVDTIRQTVKPSSWSGLQDFAETVRQAYRKDFWARMPDYVEVFVEKDAMASILEDVTAEVARTVRSGQSANPIDFFRCSQKKALPEKLWVNGGRLGDLEVRFGGMAGQMNEAVEKARAPA